MILFRKKEKKTFQIEENTFKLATWDPFGTFCSIIRNRKEE